MNIHNLMEEYVAYRVNSLYNSLMTVRPAWLTCGCTNCRLDTICYVLNKLPPRYIVSSRGVVHTSQMLEESQMRADVDALAMEGMRLISAAQRPYHKNQAKEPDAAAENGGTPAPAFHFPVFMGSVYNGITFEPLSDASIALVLDDRDVEMTDPSWQNPTYTYKSTKGAYSFWPKSIPAEKAGINRSYRFTVEASAQGFDSTVCSFEVTVVSEIKRQEAAATSFSLKIQDMFLFPANILNSAE